MKNIIFIILLNVNAKGFSQNASTFFDKAPKLKATTLIKVNEVNSFKTQKWVSIKDNTIKETIFEIVNNKNTNGVAVSNLKMLGWWGIDDVNVAFIYAYDVKEKSKMVTKVFVSSWLNNIKGADNDPFNLLPSPTGMQGKITVIQKVVVNSFGKITATQTHKSSNGKVLNKSQSYFVNEKGSLQESE